VAGLLGVMATTSRAQNGVSWSTNHYAVVGGDLRQIQRSMDRARPWKREHSQVAVTQWHIRTRFAVASFQGRFRCSGFNTQTTIRITMPRWREAESMSAEVRSEWARFHDALLEHEAGHGQIAMTAAAEMHRRVGTVRTESDPETLKQRVEQLVAQITDEYRERDAEYDRLTQHGATQGARLRRGPGRGQTVEDEQPASTGELREGRQREAETERNRVPQNVSRS